MELLDHLMYTATYNGILDPSTGVRSNLMRNVGPLKSELIDPNDTTLTGFTVPATFNERYSDANKEVFITYQDPVLIEKSIQKHWFDQVFSPKTGYLFDQGTSKEFFFLHDGPPPYHLIYAYLIENTRIFQIMERLVTMYQQDEALGIAGPTTLQNQLVSQWIINTENLFFRDLPHNSYRNISSRLRPNPEATRRNAYYRLLGMDLAFGDAATPAEAYPFHKAKTANTQFVSMFERFLVEVWQAFINASNSSGVNATDYSRIDELVKDLRRMLMSRRGGTGTISLLQYRFMNLSKEEFASVVMASWFLYVISYDSFLVNFLGCQANTPSERLMHIGKKVGIESHKKAEGLLDMAGPMQAILRGMEAGILELPNWMKFSIESQTGKNPGTLQGHKDTLNNLLIIINNWEETTGHKIKLPAANIVGTVRVETPPKEAEAFA